MFRTKITEMFGIKYPVIQGGLQGLGTSPLVAAVSKAGALGLITAGSYKDKQEMKKDIQCVRQQTSAPFGVNIAIGIRREMDEFIDGVIEERVPIVFTSGSNPEKYMSRLKAAGVKVIHVVPSVKFAKKAEAIGCDAVVIVGYECGGHPGLADNTSLTLIPKVVQELSIPVIAAGGFSDGKGLVAALSLGAEAVQMGTRFLATQENPVHDLVKRKIVELDETSTAIVKRSIRKPMRVMKTEVSEKVIELENHGASLEEIMPYIGGTSYKKLIEDGDLTQGVISLGQVVGMIHDIPTVQGLIKQIMTEAFERVNHLSKLSKLIEEEIK
ncbi:nitronate monooxygenase [Alkalihalophilus pseudofirmus]|nr:nitronate monooxygenase [Alkalihalophilus pseudofirmus]